MDFQKASSMFEDSWAVNKRPLDAHIRKGIDGHKYYAHWMLCGQHKPTGTFFTSIVTLKVLITFLLNQNIYFHQSFFMIQKKLIGRILKKNRKARKMDDYNTASKLINEVAEIYFYECNCFSDSRSKVDPKFYHINT